MCLNFGSKFLARHAQRLFCAAHIASNFTCVNCAASGTIFGTTVVYELGFSYLSFGIFRHHLNNDIQIFLPVLSKQKKYWFETISVEIPKWTFLYNTTRKGIKNSLFRQKQSNKNYFFKCFLACSISFVWYIWHINEIKKEVHLSPFYNTLIHIGTRVFRTNKTLDF